MRLAEVHVFGKTLPVVGGSFAMSRTTVETPDTTLVKLVSDTGLLGGGETCPIRPAYQPQHALGARAAIAEMAPGLVGASLRPLPFRRLMDELLAGHN
jgi:hypothetical protein